jgi:signal transduction histidine kinase
MSGSVEKIHEIITSSLIDPLTKDVELVQRISILSTLLEVVTLTTGMGFAAIARVTPDRWIACGVRDDIAFGLKPGGELEVKTTICDEIRDSRQAVIIDNVALDPAYRDHHTPKMYGIQSYISVPIILQDGSFFGTLCAIDPGPAQLNNPRVIGMFSLFVDLISFHLAALQNVDQNAADLKKSHIQLNNYKDELRQYQHISSHNLQEPLRKIRLFSDILLNAAINQQPDKVKASALKVNHYAQGLSQMIRNLSDFSGLGLTGNASEITDLNSILQHVAVRLYLQLIEKKCLINSEVLHTIKAVPTQISIVFYHLLTNSLKFARADTPLVIQICSKELSDEEIREYAELQARIRYCKICFEDNGIGISPSQLEKIFDLFNNISIPDTAEGFGVGLAQCRKIVRNHHGIIRAHSEPGKGATISIILPMEGVA